MSLLKKRNDSKKIAAFESDGRHKHGYDYEEWRPWTGNNYIKSYYDVLLENGTIIYHLWPNAGSLNRGKHFYDVDSGVKARLSANSLL